MTKTETETKLTSQIEPTNQVFDILTKWSLTNITKPENLTALRDRLFSHLTFLSYDDTTKEEEKGIRWRRTGSQILSDGFVYQGKACTDLVVTFLTLARAGGVKNTSFVKLRNAKTGMVHSVGEFQLDDDRYIFDVANKDTVPVKGVISENGQFGAHSNPYILWKKGRDSWDLGLTEFESINKIANTSELTDTE